MVLLAGVDDKGEALEQLRLLLGLLLAAREQAAALLIGDAHEHVLEHDAIVADQIVHDDLEVVESGAVHLEELAVEEHVEHLLLPGLACVRIGGEAHEQLRRRAIIILISRSLTQRHVYNSNEMHQHESKTKHDYLDYDLRVCLQIRPQIGHERQEQRHDESVLLVAFVDNVERLGQILIESKSEAQI